MEWTRLEKICLPTLLSTGLVLLSMCVAGCGGGSAGGGGGSNGGGGGGSSGGGGSNPPTITSVSVGPSSPSVQTSATQQFTATVTGTGAYSSTVTWAVNGTTGGTPAVGTISAAGLYTAPAAVPSPSTLTISATSTEDTTMSGQAQVTVTAPISTTPSITSISPAQGAPGDVIQISGANLGYPTQTVVFSGPNGIGIPVTVSQGSPTSLSVRVPLETISGPVFAEVPQPSGSPLTTNGLPFTRLPDLRIRAPQKDLGAGETESLNVVVFGSSTPQTIVWSANSGSITSSGTYTAPGSLQSDSFAQITACIQGTQTCDDLLLGLHPFRVSPTAPVVALGNSLELEALAAGQPESATWTQNNGYGNLSNGGTYAAPTIAAEAGPTVVTATNGGIQESASIGVTGGFPGLVNRIYDYVDLTTVQIQRFTLPLSVAVSTNRAYVLSTQDDSGALDRKFFYIDVYDLTDPVHPVWVAATEAAAAGQLYVSGNILYDINPNGINGSLSSAIAAYDISGVSPVLLDRKPMPTLSSWAYYGGVFTAYIDQVAVTSAGASTSVDQYSLQGTTIVDQPISIPPAVSGQTYNLGAVAATATRLYATAQGSSTAAEPVILADYDVTTNPPTLLGTVSLPAGTIFEAGAFNTNSYLYTAGLLFDITQDPPAIVGGLPGQVFDVLDANANTFLGASYQTGLNVITASGSPATFQVKYLFDFPNVIRGGAFFGNYVYSAEVYGGLGVYDASVDGGINSLYPMIPNNFDIAIPYAQASNGSTLVAGACGLNSCDVWVFGIGSPPVLEADVSMNGIPPNALAFVNNDLFVGTAQSLLVYDLSQPSAPNQIGSVNTPISALAASGSFLYAGSGSNQLLAYNIASPASPVLVATVSLPDIASQITVDGSLLLVADTTGGLMVFDISTPANPTLLSQVAITPAALGVQSSGNLALVAALESGLVIVDLTSPASPQIASQTGLDSIDPFSTGISLYQNRAAVIAIQGQIAFVGANNFDTSDLPENGNGMIYGFDFSQPQHPRLVSLGAYADETAGFISSLCVVGNNLYVGGPGVTYVEYDATQPRNSINLFYPPSALRLPPPPPPPVP
jgi:hypothetical protein